MRRNALTTRASRGTPPTIRERLAAGLGLVALALLLGHVHPAHDAAGHDETPGAPVVSDDSAHHEHSSHATIESAPCVTCRSFGDDAIAARCGTPAAPIDPLPSTFRERAASAPRAPFAGLPATRAPPIAVLG